MTKEEGKKIYKILEETLKEFRIKRAVSNKKRSNKNAYKEMKGVIDLAQYHISQNEECYKAMFGENPSGVTYYDYLSIEYFEESINKILARIKTIINEH